jgi:hypothetical protein
VFGKDYGHAAGGEQGDGKDFGRASHDVIGLGFGGGFAAAK